MGTTIRKTTATQRRLFAGLTAGLALLAVTETAQAQEILLTGPLAGAPAVRQLRLFREGRFEVAPLASFTMLDEFQRTILFGARITYNFTDWLGLGVWGAYGALKLPTHLTDEIQAVNEDRRTQAPTSVDRRLVAVNMGENFEDQLGGMDWIVAPQLVGVPFRGKLSLFKSIYVDTEMFFFAGPAFVGLTERAECDSDATTSTMACTEQTTEDPATGAQPDMQTASRMAIAPTAGMGFSFFVNRWNAITAEARITPFSWNTGGFDTAGGDPDGEFPDNDVDDNDRQFRFNMMLTVGYSFYFPLDHRISE